MNQSSNFSWPSAAQFLRIPGFGLRARLSINSLYSWPITLYFSHLYSTLSKVLGKDNRRTEQ